VHQTSAKINSLFILTALSLPLASSSSFAQAQTDLPQANVSAKIEPPDFDAMSRAIGEDPGPVYTAKVKEWAQTTNFAKNAAEVAVGKLEMDMKSNPQLAKFVTVNFTSELEQFFYQLFVSQETMQDLARLYAQYFTLDEMQELIDFYRTPIGKKLTKTNPQIMLHSQQIGAKLLKKNERAYMEIIGKYLKNYQPKQDSAQEQFDNIDQLLGPAPQ